MARQSFQVWSGPQRPTALLPQRPSGICWTITKELDSSYAARLHLTLRIPLMTGGTMGEEGRNGGKEGDSRQSKEGEEEILSN